MERETEDRLFVFGAVAAIVFVALLIVAIIVAFAEWLFGMIGVAVILLLVVLSLIVAGGFVWIFGDDL